jgi:phosphatidylglycerophosphate synthase
VSAADALGILRLGAALALPGALASALQGSRWWVPPALFLAAAASDFFDGALARRGRGATRHGAVLDNVADVAFVLAGTGAGAALGLVSWLAPLAIVVSFGAYAVASLERTARARSELGHAGGVLNYALAGVVAGAAAFPGSGWRPVLRLASALVIAVNLAAVLERAAPWAVRPARGPRDAGRAAR